MPFNITNFKSALDKFGGPSRSNIFEVRISSTPKKNTSAIRPRDFSFFCKNITIPGIQFATAVDSNVAQMPKDMPMTMNKEPVNAIFMCDSEHQVLRFFHSWMQTIVNFGTSLGSFSEVDGQLPFEVGYRSDYAQDIIIRHYTTDSQEYKYYETKLINAFPIGMGDIDLAWENNDSFMTLPISFSYDRIQFDGEIGGTNRSGLGRGGGLLETIGAIAGFADVVRQTVNQGNSVTSVQDAVNRFTRVRNSFDNISDRLGGG